MLGELTNVERDGWNAERAATYLSVSSGKGGVGKTNFAINLAFWLSQMGERVLIFDADLGLANVDILLSLSVSKSIRKYLNGQEDIGSIIKKNVYGFDVFPASTGFVELTALSEKDFNMIVDAFVRVDNDYDFIIFDTGAGISESVIKFASIADKTIAVSNPEPTAITDAYSFMKAINKHYDIQSVEFVMNRADDVNSAEALVTSLQAVTKKFLNMEINYLGCLREDIGLRKAVRSQKPISVLDPKSPYSSDVQKIAAKLTRHAKSTSTSGTILNLMKRLIR